MPARKRLCTRWGGGELCTVRYGRVRTCLRTVWSKGKNVAGGAGFERSTYGACTQSRVGPSSSLLFPLALRRWLIDSSPPPQTSPNACSKGAREGRFFLGFCSPSKHSVCRLDWGGATEGVVVMVGGGVFWASGHPARNAFTTNVRIEVIFVIFLHLY